jgi:hypothetical protein
MSAGRRELHQVLRLQAHWQKKLVQEGLHQATLMHRDDRHHTRAVVSRRQHEDNG